MFEFVFVDLFVCVCFSLDFCWVCGGGGMFVFLFFLGNPFLSAGQKPKGIASSVEQHLQFLYFRNMIQPF